MSERILVVEDNRALAENVAELLEADGTEIVSCKDVASAAREARAGGFDLAIVDIGLSGRESGLDLLPTLRQASLHGEILLMTGNATLNSAIEAIRSGVYAYIIKPFEPAQFTSLARRALAQVALKRDKYALTQRALASEALYRAVVDTSEACILGLDLDATVRLSNRFACELLELTPAQLIGHSFLALCQHSQLRDAFERARAGESVRNLDCVHAMPLGAHTIRWTLRPLNVSDVEAGQLVAASDQEPVVLAVGIDLTDRLELERKNAEAEAMAAMGTLTTSLAHEIRNPLNAASLQLELLLRRARKITDPEVRSQLAEPTALVRSELDRLSALLDDFLNLARPRGLALHPCCVADLLEAVAVLKGPLAHSLGIALRASLPERELLVRADSDKLKQVLINLVGNAIEALHEVEQTDGVVVLQAERTPGGVRISVSDNGPGVPADLEGSAFKPFVTSKQGGTGLGLAIVHKIVSQHGGDVRLVAICGGGTCAELTIPGWLSPE